ncbi:MAG: hypothetical protein QOK15_2138, partial [Nocardioidaceae bacterium]|nr:hypothetical protein [Nocardioidaceae bacterium]
MPLDLTAALSDAAIRRATYGSGFAKGVLYAAEGRVAEVRLDEGTGTLSARVRGNARQPYLTQVVLRGVRHNPGLHGTAVASTRCTCPVSTGCKHAAALMLVARARFAGTYELPRPMPTWERHLANLLDGLGGAAASPATTPVALQFELTLPGGGHARRTAPQTIPARLAIRPVVWGRSGTWVRSGISWDELRYVSAARGFNSDHLEILTEFDRLSVAGYGYRREPAIDLRTVSRGLWGLLDQAKEVGLPLVQAGRSARPVVVHPDAAQLRLDLRRPALDADLSMRPEIRVPGRDGAEDEVLPLSSVGFLGSPAHGCFILPASLPDSPERSDADTLVLLRLDRAISMELQRFLDHAGELRIPADDADRFVSTYYPRLRQSTTIGSDDGSVALPVVSGPRLSLRVSFSPPSTMALSWSFAYAVDGVVRRYPLADLANTPSVRDRSAETRLLEQVELPNDPVRLVEPFAATTRLIAEQTLTGMDTVSFTQQTLPLLRQIPQVDVEVVGDLPDFRLADSAPRISLAATDSDDADWFDLGVTVTVDDHEVAFADLFAALAAGESHLLLDGGTFFSLDDPAFETLSRLISEARALSDQPRDGLRITPFQAGLWEDLVEIGEVDEQSRRWASTVEGLLS